MLAWFYMTSKRLSILYVDQGILLMKLETIGLVKDVVRWFRSDLVDRQQLVDVSSTF